MKDELTKDACDYCSKTVYLGGGDDIFLEGWGRSLSCADCCGKYNLLEKWESGKDEPKNL